MFKILYNLKLDDNPKYRNFQIALIAGAYFLKFLEWIFPPLRRKDFYSEKGKKLNPEDEPILSQLKNSFKMSLLFVIGAMLWEYLFALAGFFFSKRIVYFIYPVYLSIIIFIVCFVVFMLVFKEMRSKKRKLFKTNKK